MISGSRPQSAATGHSSSFSKLSNSFVRDYDPMDNMAERSGGNNDPSGFDQTMRSSFYSTRNGGFNKERGGVIESLQPTSVLDFSPEDMKKIEQIRDFMKEQADGLQQETEELKTLLMKQSAAEGDDDVTSCAPSEKELKEYSSRLQDQLLHSDQTIKIQ